MYKNVLRSIEGIEILPIVGLLIFIVFFLLWAIAAFRSNKSYIKHMEEMPLDLDTPTEHPKS